MRSVHSTIFWFSFPDLLSLPISSMNALIPKEEQEYFWAEGMARAGVQGGGELAQSLSDV